MKKAQNNGCFFVTQGNEQISINDAVFQKLFQPLEKLVTLAPTSGDISGTPLRSLILDVVSTGKDVDDLKIQGFHFLGDLLCLSREYLDKLLGNKVSWKLQNTIAQMGFRQFGLTMSPELAKKYGKLKNNILEKNNG